MLDEILKQEDIVQESKQKSNSRLFGGIILGFIFGVYILSTIDRGAFVYFYLYIHKNVSIKLATQEWNPFSWNNWFLRFVGCVLSSYAGAIISGLVARKRGNVVGVLSSIPSLLFWLYYFYSQYKGNMEFGFGYIEIISNTTSKIMAIALALVNIIIGFHGGSIGEKLSKNFYNSFNKRKYTLLGIKWYHYLWFPLIAYFILIQGIFASFCVLEKFLIIKNLPKYSLISAIKGILAIFLGFIACISVLIYYMSLTKSYKILSGLTFCKSNKEKIFKIFIYLIGFTILSLLIQYGNYYLEYIIF